MKEIWKDITGYIGHYKISNIGRVKSLERYRKGKCNSISHKKEMILNCEKTKVGYLRATLLKNGVSKRYSVHRLVASAFIKNKYNKPQINHKNGIKDDNRVENLEWVTGSENMKHAIKNNLSKNPVIYGRSYEKNPNSKILLNLDSGIFHESMKEASECYGYNYTTLSNMLNGHIENKSLLVKTIEMNRNYL